ncbi:MAG: hypothetical protein EXS17_07215 [Phycisphaerales bacterium]|nr:hypothetical protein [Phycisphaerales bacterium]
MKMNRRSRIVALFALNALLIVAILVLPLASSADGQAGVFSRGRATYSMAGGNIPATSMGAIYIVDETHEEMIGLVWNEKTKSISSFGYRNLAADSAASARVRP